METFGIIECVLCIISTAIMIKIDFFSKSNKNKISRSKYIFTLGNASNSFVSLLLILKYCNLINSSIAYSVLCFLFTISALGCYVIAFFIMRNGLYVHKFTHR